MLIQQCCDAVQWLDDKWRELDRFPVFTTIPRDGTRLPVGVHLWSAAVRLCRNNIGLVHFCIHICPRVHICSTSYDNDTFSVSNDTTNHRHHHDHRLDMTLEVTEAVSNDTTNHRHHHDHHLDMTLDVTKALSNDTTNHRHHHDHHLDMTLDVGSVRVSPHFHGLGVELDNVAFN